MEAPSWFENRALYLLAVVTNIVAALGISRRRQSLQRINFEGATNSIGMLGYSSNKRLCYAIIIRMDENSICL